MEVKGSNGCGVLEGKGPSTIKYEADGTQPPLTTAVLEAAAAGGDARRLDVADETPASP